MRFSPRGLAAASQPGEGSLGARRAQGNTNPDGEQLSPVTHPLPSPLAIVPFAHQLVPSKGLRSGKMLIQRVFCLLSPPAPLPRPPPDLMLRDGGSPGSAGLSQRPVPVGLGLSRAHYGSDLLGAFVDGG